MVPFFYVNFPKKKIGLILSFCVCLVVSCRFPPSLAAASEPGGAALPGAAGPQGRVLEEAGGAAAL